MAELSAKARYSIAKQAEMFRLAERDYGLTIAELARQSGISKSTIKGWRDGSAMPAWALGELGIPDELASLVLDPFNKFVGTAGEDDGDLDALATKASEFLAEYSRARHPASAGGIHIVPQERAGLTELRQGLRAYARKAA